ncbi:MAG TPA: UvrD-helicase domain-containing protein [Streptosporangiaceae bacterium]|jgi:superfamily I DNA/RNA helicase/PHP family Zn ribbon phosphoesterase
MFHADLHIHSRFSRACSKNCDIPGLAWWALRKGVTVVGTGDFTHPGWAAELRETLVPAEPGLLQLRPDLAGKLRRNSPPTCDQPVRFMLSTEISTIYRAGERTRKVHHLLYAPTLEAAGKITDALAKVGNLASDGRPILGLDSRHLLDITLNAGPGCYLVPAHIWTPWFAVLGSKSGFDVVADCYGDLASQVFAVETGLSSDPPMNWMCSSLDGYRLVSNSDAHSPPMLGREATTLDVELDYFAIERALRTGAGLQGTVNFFPEGGRYHLDGHRKCGIRLEPGQSAAHGGICPGCGRPLTIGVLNRVTGLADRPAGYRPDGAAGSVNLVSLPDVVGELLGAGPKSKKVDAEVSRLVAALGPELDILLATPPGELSRAGGTLLGEAITRLRAGSVRKEAGYDGEYGVIRLFGPGELARGTAALFDVAAPGSLAGPVPEPRRPGRPAGRPAEPAARDQVAGGGPAHEGAGEERPRDASPGGSFLDRLDPEQRAAAAAAAPLMIIAGPGTGKTRTLTHRLAAGVAEQGVPPEACLALTFTRRAAEEMRERLAALLGGRSARLTVTTFHGLGLMILREHHELAGLAAGFTVADEKMVLEVAAGLAGSPRAGRALLAGASADPHRRELLRNSLAARDLVDFDGLVELAVAVLDGEPAVAARLRERWPRISVDEYQDIDAAQYALLRLLAGDGTGLTVIGDPDQAIYRFRGADVGFFLRFGQDYPAASAAVLTMNYRSSPGIVAGSLQAIAPATLVPGRVLRAAAGSAPGRRISVHEAADPAGEAAWIAESIDRLLGGSSFHSLDSGRADGHGHGGIGLADIAVLYRTDAQAAPLGQGLARAGLPFQKRSHDLLDRRPGVAEILRELALAGLTADRGPGPRAVGAAVTYQLRATVGRLADAADAGRRPGAGRGGLSGTDLRTAGEVLAPLARRCGDDMERFRTEIALGAEVDALDPRADAVALLTLHAAKGLEFEVVFLAGCERDLLPLWLPGAAPDARPDPAEERRLLFVGMTRARAHLLLSCAARRSRHGSSAETGISPFLSAIDPGLLDRSAPAPARRPAARQLRLL